MIEELRIAERKGYHVNLSLLDGSAYSGMIKIHMDQNKLRLKYHMGIVTIPLHEITHCSRLIAMPV